MLRSLCFSSLLRISSLFIRSTLKGSELNLINPSDLHNKMKEIDNPVKQDQVWIATNTSKKNSLVFFVFLTFSFVSNRHNKQCKSTNCSTRSTFLLFLLSIFSPLSHSSLPSVSHTLSTLLSTPRILSLQCLNSINYPSQHYSAHHSSLRLPTSPLPSQQLSRQWSVPRSFPCKTVSLNTKVSSLLRHSAKSTPVSSTSLPGQALLSLPQ